MPKKTQTQADGNDLKNPGFENGIQQRELGRTQAEMKKESKNRNQKV